MSKYSENTPPSLRDAIGWMFDYIKEDKVFLDFGCATGYFGQLIKQAKNNKVYGLEISDDLEQARKVLDGVYSFDLDGEWPEEIYERTYDYLFFGDVIEHLKDPELVLKKCKRLLKKDGLLFISTPNIAHISIRLELLGGNFEYEPMGILDNTHLKYFTDHSLTELVKHAGYGLVAKDFTANDYPDDVVKKLLKGYGLTPSQKFWDMVNKPEARAFQHKFVLSASPAKVVTTKVSVPEKPEQIRNAEFTDLKGQVTNLRKHAQEQAKIIQYLKDENTKLTEQLTPFNKKLARRAVHKLRHPTK